MRLGIINNDLAVFEEDETGFWATILNPEDVAVLKEYINIVENAQNTSYELKKPEKISKKSYVYFIQSDDFVKIGFTTNIESRLASLQTSIPNNLQLLGVMFGSVSDEKMLHSKFSDFRVRNNGEWFCLNEEIMGFIKENCKPDVKSLRD